MSRWVVTKLTPRRANIKEVPQKAVERPFEGGQGQTGRNYPRKRIFGEVLTSQIPNLGWFQRGPYLGKVSKFPRGEPKGARCVWKPPREKRFPVWKTRGFSKRRGGRTPRGFLFTGGGAPLRRGRSNPRPNAPLQGGFFWGRKPLTWVVRGRDPTDAGPILL